jgi:DNA-directed RNA polymerase subunit L
VATLQGKKGEDLVFLANTLRRAAMAEISFLSLEPDIIFNSSGFKKELMADQLRLLYVPNHLTTNFVVKMHAINKGETNQIVYPSQAECFLELQDGKLKKVENPWKHSKLHITSLRPNEELEFVATTVSDTAHNGGARFNGVHAYYQYDQPNQIQMTFESRMRETAKTSYNRAILAVVQKLNVLKQQLESNDRADIADKSQIRIKLVGENDTLGNLLHGYLVTKCGPEQKLKVAGCNMEHPMIEEVTLFMEANNKSTDVLDYLIKLLGELEKKLLGLRVK